MPDYDYIRKELLRNGVTKSSYGQNTWSIAVLMERNLLCILKAYIFVGVMIYSQYTYVRILSRYEAKIMG
ncbi:hypothetical protein [Mediterraneibacter faecis]|uniref:hypothetical protein n=1 Tax=Mediterraneibacter faecis TaxID=592978 RepID=UPI003CEDAB69